MIHLRTLGGVDLSDSAGGDMRPVLAQPKRLALLVYLALAEASGFRRRDKTVALFWPELDDEHARGSLRQALSFLRRALGEGVIVTRGDEEIGVSRGALDCDASLFLDAPPIACGRSPTRIGPPGVAPARPRSPGKLPASRLKTRAKSRAW
jgi:serine/threonine-protein kinase